MKIKGACRWWANFLHINTKWCHHRRSEFTATIWGQVNGIEICYWMHKMGRHWCEILIAHKGAQTSPIEADQLHQELEGHVPKPWEHCKIQEPTVRIYETYFWAPVLWHIHIQEFLNVKKSMVALLTPKCVSKYAMLDCIEGNDPTWVAVILSGSKDTVAEKGS